MACPKCGGTTTPDWTNWKAKCDTCGFVFALGAQDLWLLHGAPAVGYEEGKQRWGEARYEIGTIFFDEVMGTDFRNLKSLHMDTVKEARKEERKRRKEKDPAAEIERYWKSEAPKKFDEKGTRAGWNTLKRGKVIQNLVDHGYSIRFIYRVLRERGLDNNPQRSFIIYCIVEKYKDDVLDLWAQYSKDANLKDVDTVADIVAQIAALIHATPWCVRVTLVYTKNLAQSWLLSKILSDEVRPILESWSKKFKEKSRYVEQAELIKELAKEYKTNPHRIFEYVSAITPLRLVVKFYAVLSEKIVAVIKENQPINLKEINERVNLSGSQLLTLLVEAGEIKRYAYKDGLKYVYYVDDKYEEAAKEKYLRGNYISGLQKIIDESEDGISAIALSAEYKERSGVEIAPNKIYAYVRDRLKDGAVTFIPFIGEKGGLYINPKNSKGQNYVLRHKAESIVEAIKNHTALTRPEIAKATGESVDVLNNFMPALVKRGAILKYPPEAFPGMVGTVYYVDGKKIDEVKKIYLKGATVSGRLYEIIREKKVVPIKKLRELYKETWNTDFSGSAKNQLKSFIKHGLVERVPGIYNETTDYVATYYREQAGITETEDETLWLIIEDGAFTADELATRRRRSRQSLIKPLKRLIEKGLVFSYPEKPYPGMRDVLYYADKSRLEEVKKMHAEKARPTVRLYQIIKEYPEGIHPRDLLDEYEKRYRVRLKSNKLSAYMLRLVNSGDLIAVKKGRNVVLYKIPSKKSEEKSGILQESLREQPAAEA